METRVRISKGLVSLGKSNVGKLADSHPEAILCSNFMNAKIMFFQCDFNGSRTVRALASPEVPRWMIISGSNSVHFFNRQTEQGRPH